MPKTFVKKTLVLRAEAKRYEPKNGDPARDYFEYTVDVNGIPIIMRTVPKDYTAARILANYFQTETE